MKIELVVTGSPTLPLHVIQAFLMAARVRMPISLMLELCRDPQNDNKIMFELWDSRSGTAAVIGAVDISIGVDQPSPK